jgi:hypothetical protein
MLNKYEIRYKSFLKMEKRLSVVQDLLRKLPLIELKQSYQSGWYIRYEFRSDVSRRKDIEILKEVLRVGWDAYNVTFNPSDITRIRKGEFFRVIKKGKSKIDYRPKRGKIDEKEYLSLSTKVQHYFHLDTTSDIYRLYGRKYYEASLPSYWLTLKVKPRIITHIRKRGGLLEKEYQFLRDKLWEFWRENHGYRKHFPTGEERTETRTKIQKFIKGESDDISLGTYRPEWD